ncbi:hypothetical protein GCM10008908_00730 [Clostridium subterminale]|uniref:Uncharacterized protein n=1 Tax=Clostridium subterminale TaxID=1550 RepID=A0ABN1KF27_CLOSU
MQHYEYYPNITEAKPLVDILKDKGNVEIDHLLKLKKRINSLEFNMNKKFLSIRMFI